MRQFYLKRMIWLGRQLCEAKKKTTLKLSTKPTHVVSPQLLWRTTSQLQQTLFEPPREKEQKATCFPWFLSTLNLKAPATWAWERHADILLTVLAGKPKENKSFHLLLISSYLGWQDFHALVSKTEFQRCIQLSPPMLLSYECCSLKLW